MEEEIKKITRDIEKLAFSSQEKFENSKVVPSSVRSFIFRTASSKISHSFKEDNLSEEKNTELKNIEKVNSELFSPIRNSLPLYTELIERKSEVDKIFALVLEEK